ncbi:Tim44/TimA family putative adaptor protein [Consotaella salsifontis]|uniref:Predicted lipid-binding transport protein, Tim44 family n=1 Tax=Consotaella salsifontis TaxID=1365950 RepID=A0A1T4T4W1_9HYPH|nr:Tim44/TimA family putative adaptor protein [Consotaella salsifontis]SKA35437.1 Predicted lipid-binding transport protein, Tim44 family [Consotaella salsifontis]
MSFGTIFFIVLGAIVLYQLRSVLGRRTGSERPPFDPYSRPETPASSGNVITLPNRGAATGEEIEAKPNYEAIDKVAPPTEPLNAELRRIRDVDAAFDPKQFIDGAKIAYEMIVAAFATGDRKTLKNLLSDQVYQGFDAAIAERERRGEKMQSSFVGIEDAKIVSAELRGREALVTVRIVSQMISATLAADGQVIEGDPETVVEIRDVWTFGRDTRSRDPNWKLVETETEDQD